MSYLEPNDLVPFRDIDASKAVAMIADAEAQAVLVAPCLSDPASLNDHQRAAVKAVLRSVVLRWDEAGTGALQQETAGPFGFTVDTRQQRRSLFWPSEIEQLQKVCEQVAGGTSGAFAVDTAPGCNTVHDVACSLTFGATYCSCGASLAGVPLWGVDE